MQTDSRVVHKTPISVEITLTDGSMFRGLIFTTPKGRLIDVLNDERDFIPVGSPDGSVTAIAKTAIKQIALPVIDAPVYRGSDPYQILGVAESVSDAKLKEAYHQMSLANHPDRIRGFGLAGDFVELASNNMVRINNAYAQIMRQRKKAESEAFGAEAPKKIRGKGVVTPASPTKLRVLASGNHASPGRSFCKLVPR